MRIIKWQKLLIRLCSWLFRFRLTAIYNGNGQLLEFCETQKYNHLFIMLVPLPISTHKAYRFVYSIIIRPRLWINSLPIQLVLAFDLGKRMGFPLQFLEGFIDWRSFMRSIICQNYMIVRPRINWFAPLREYLY